MIYFRFFYGRNSPFNLAGKILLTPVALPLLVTFMIFELLFAKPE